MMLWTDETVEHWANRDIIVRRWTLAARYLCVALFAFAVGMVCAASLIGGGVR